ncbi:hypothetical protein VCRA2119O147_560025 [Vibrio crassostreae]|nr:hypothetical protein VCRA2119O147_560025 [Vibrio crassostreae]CAK2910098.1 hypothetical protein VCRA2110O183_420018 [Vibrio crassostreae]CAK2984826.1 hypothetical protein VCRA2121O264_420019 [Vibrio crassostreae]CAK3659339.1 hypothetical protein VCRA2121O262_440011 [Vibrio crassostreae]
MTQNIEQRTEVAVKKYEGASHVVDLLGTTDSKVVTPVGERSSFPKLSRELEEDNVQRKDEFQAVQESNRNDFHSDQTFRSIEHTQAQSTREREFQDRFSTVQEVKQWLPNTPVNSELQRYYIGVKNEPSYKELLPDPNKLPFVTGETIDGDYANKLWLENGVPNVPEVKRRINVMEGRALNGVRWPDDGSDLKVGDLTPAGITRLQVDDKILYLFDDGFSDRKNKIKEIRNNNDYGTYIIVSTDENDLNEQAFEFVTYQVNQLRGRNAWPLSYQEVWCEGWGLSVKNLPSDNRTAFQTAIEFCKKELIGRVNFGSGRFLVEQINVINTSIIIQGQNRSDSLLVNEGSGNVFACLNTDVDGWKRTLRFKSFGIGLPIDEKVHTSRGSHGIFTEGYNDVEFDDFRIHQAGGSGIRVRRTWVVTFQSVLGGHCGQNDDFSGTDLGVLDFKRDGGSGNSVRLSNCYLSNSKRTDGLNIDYVQSLSLADTTIESCQRLVAIGKVGYSTRSVEISGACYFENPYVCCGEFINIYGLNIFNAYTNLTGPGSPTVEAVFKFDLVDRVKIRGGALAAPPTDVGNELYKGALEFKTYGSLSVPGQVDIEGTSSVNTICINSDEFGRESYSIKHNSAGLYIKSINNLEKPHSNLFHNTDISTWSNPGNLPIEKGEFFDGSEDYTVLGNGTDYISTSITKDVKVGDEVCFSAWIEGKCRLRVRGRKSDGSYEDISNYLKLGSETGANEAGDVYRRAYANGKAVNNYTLINVMIIPYNQVSIAYVQMDESLTPSAIK